MFGSAWTFVPAGLVALLFAIRTLLEDTLLRRELHDYDEYARRTRYRLLPGGLVAPLRRAQERRRMPHDDSLADRIRAALARKRGVAEKRMFGGVAFLHRGHMFCGVVGADLMVRVGPAAYEGTLERPHVRAMDFTGRPMRGLVFVAAPGVRSARQLEAWIERGLAFTRSLPAK